MRTFCGQGLGSRRFAEKACVCDFQHLLELLKLDLADDEIAVVLDLDDGRTGPDLDTAAGPFGIPPLPVRVLDGDWVAILMAVDAKV